MLNDLISSKVDWHQRNSMPCLRRGRRSSGFTLLEMLVGIALMVVLGGMVFGLFNKHATVYKLQQEVTELNLGLRSGLELISADLLNAGANLSAGGSQRFPFPVMVGKNANGNFDSITVYQGYKQDNALNYVSPTTLTKLTGIDPGVPIPINNTATLYLNPAPGLTAAQTAALLPAGAYIVIVNTDTSDPNYGQIAPLTLAGGSIASNCGASPCVQISTTGGLDNGSGLVGTGQGDGVAPAKLGTSFPFGAMVVKLAPRVTYLVDTAIDPVRPALVRTTTTAAGESRLQLVSNLLSFSQRARMATGTFNNPDDYTGIDPLGNLVAMRRDFSLIQSVEVTIAGRTATDRIDRYQSAIDPTKTFRLNTLTTVVALRNKVN